MSEIIGYKEVEEKVMAIRDQKVILDRDVAELYGVTTKEINQAVKNNSEKFPEGYVFTLHQAEKEYVVKNFDHLELIKFSRVNPSAFTEKGLYMLATILKSPKAVQTTIAIVETFSKMRELSQTISLLPEVMEESQRKNLLQRGGEILTDVLDDNLLEVSGDETTIELNLAVMKIKHTVKREKR